MNWLRVFAACEADSVTRRAYTAAAASDATGRAHRYTHVNKAHANCQAEFKSPR